MPDRVVILIGEPEQNYVLLIQQVLTLAEIPSTLRAVSIGEDVTAYLKGDGKYGDRIEFPLPTHLLVSTKLPGNPGLEILRWVRSQPAFSPLHIVLLASFDEMNNLNDAYALGANSFLLKPHDFTDLLHLANLLPGILGLSKTRETIRSSKVHRTISH